RLVAGAKESTLSVDVGKLNRMVRVIDGLPARMRQPMPTKCPEAPLADAELSRLQAALVEPALTAALVAAVGAERLGPSIEDSWIEVAADGVWVADGHSRHRIVDEFAALARQVDGQVLASEDWDELRAIAADLSITLTNRSARATRVAAALRENHS